MCSVTLSSLASPDEIAAVRLIKIDVEEAESKLISDLGFILDNSRKDLEVVIEISTDAFDDVVSFFRKHVFSRIIWRTIIRSVPILAKCVAKDPGG